MARAADQPATSTDDLKSFEEARTERYADQLEAWLGDFLVNHYETLGLGERMEMDLHEGGHEARVESGVRFLQRWLMPETPHPGATSGNRTKAR